MEKTMLSLNVPKMACEGCAETVEGAVKSVDQNAKVTIDLATKRVDIVSAADAAKIAAAIRAAGYDTTAAG
jgi:copper chaperone